MNWHIGLHAMKEIDQVFLLLVSLVILIVLTIPLAYDTVTDLKRMAAKEILAYAVLIFGTGRIAIEGLISCWQYWL